jgi:hypothetical protein
MGHVAAQVPTSEVGCGPEPMDVCQRRSPPRRGGEVRRRGTRGYAGALLDVEVGSRVLGHVAGPEHS